MPTKTGDGPEDRKLVVTIVYFDLIFSQSEVVFQSEVIFRSKVIFPRLAG